MSTTNSNLWTWKDSELETEMTRLGIELKEYDRKKAVDAIKLALVEGEVKDTKTHIEEMKEKEPTLEMRRVIFHSITEQDMPYVFVGHNGRGYYLPKEQELDVPVYILDSCIKDAVEDRLFPETQTDGSIEWKSRRVQRFPYSYVN